MFQRAREAMAGPLGRTLEVYDGKRLGRRPLNNAWLVAHRVYSTGLDELDLIYESENRDLRAGVRRIVALHPAAPVAAADGGAGADDPGERSPRRAGAPDLLPWRK